MYSTVYPKAFSMSLPHVTRTIAHVQVPLSAIGKIRLTHPNLSAQASRRRFRSGPGAKLHDLRRCKLRGSLADVQPKGCRGQWDMIGQP